MLGTIGTKSLCPITIRTTEICSTQRSPTHRGYTVQQFQQINFRYKLSSTNKIKRIYYEKMLYYNNKNICFSSEYKINPQHIVNNQHAVQTNSILICKQTYKNKINLEKKNHREQVGRLIIKYGNLFSDHSFEIKPISKCSSCQQLSQYKVLNSQITSKTSNSIQENFVLVVMFEWFFKYVNFLNSQFCLPIRETVI
ncbi:hypothetical protein ABPG74_013908 [Tetrahymena malaccensis]